MTLNPDNDYDPPHRDQDDDTGWDWEARGPLPDPELDGPDPADADQGCPPELEGIPARELAAEADAAAMARGPAPPELMEAGFYRHPRAARAILAGNPVQQPGFAQGGVLDMLAPGPGLAGFADEACERGAGLAGVSDDELIGVLGAFGRIEAWSHERTLAATAELARRRPAPGFTPAPAGQVPDHFGEFTADEIAAATRISTRAADWLLGYSLAVEGRLPRTRAALNAGRITADKAQIIAHKTGILSGEHAAQADAMIFPRACDLTPESLRKALDRIIDEIDPGAAARRHQASRRAARIRHWREDAGTAALAGYGLPPADVLAADQHIDLHARALRAAGVDGTLDQLRALVYIDLLLERDPAARAAGDEPDTDRTGPADGTAHGSNAGDADEDSADDTDDDFDEDDEGGDDGKGPGGPGSGGRGPAGGRAAAPAPLASMAQLIIPLRSLLGIAGVPGEVAGFGPVGPAALRDLAAAASAHPQTRWCVTVTDDDGYAVGHGCAAGRHDILSHAGLTDDTGPPGTSPPRTRPGGSRDGPPGGRDHPPGGNRDGPPSPAGPGIGEILRKLGVTIEPIARGTCDHRHEEPGYKPSRKLRHLVAARTATCTSPGCGQTWARSDFEHTVPYDQGGRTCECDGGPTCRHDHRKKQSRGWKLEQPEPGIMRWTAPSGRQYVTGPTQYPA
jgi:hypothetical protein